MSTTKLTKRNIALLIITAFMILGIIIFCIANWQVVYKLFHAVIEGTDIMKDYILNLGWIGIVACMVLMIICFFFPFISSLPVQIAVGITYGIGKGGLIIIASFAIASQLLFLFKQDAKIFYSKKKLIKQKELAEKIKNSSRGIDEAMLIAYIVPFIPFLLISNVASSGLKYWKYSLYTTFGPIPEVIVTVYLGSALLNKSPIASIISLIIIIAIVILSIVYNDEIIDFIFVKKKKENKDGTEN